MEAKRNIMKTVAEYSFKNGKNVLIQNFNYLLKEVYNVIASVDASKCKNKKSKELTMKGKILYSPIALNDEFKNYFTQLGWKNKKIKCKYSNKYYVNNYIPKSIGKMPYREMDFVKNKVGVEVQFGKYAFMVYNVCAKMTIFKKLVGIKAGIEIVPVKDLADQMSTGVSYFEQIVWDLEHRGVANIDLPVLIIGIAP